MIRFLKKTFPKTPDSSQEVIFLIPEKIMVDFDENKVLKIAICTPSGSRCASVGVAGLEIDND